MTAMAPAVLLDTCALIWLADGAKLRGNAEAVIREAGLAEGVFVSVVSAWELGLLAASRSAKASGLSFHAQPSVWFARVMDRPAFRQAPLTAAAAITSAFLPGDLHRDPADRLLIASARELDLPIVTRDRRILDYAEAGHVLAIAC